MSTQTNLLTTQVGVMLAEKQHLLKRETSLSLTPGSEEKHTLVGEFSIVPEEALPETLVQGQKVANPMPKDMELVFIYVAPGQKVTLIHARHEDQPISEIGEGLWGFFKQIEANPLTNGVQEAWD